MLEMSGIWAEKNARNERNLSGIQKCKKWAEIERNKKCKKWAEFERGKMQEMRGMVGMSGILSGNWAKKNKKWEEWSEWADYFVWSEDVSNAL